MNYTPCHRCQGVGYISIYKHVQNGICFRCRGQRYEELIKNESEEGKEIHEIDHELVDENNITDESTSQDNNEITIGEYIEKYGSIYYDLSVGQFVTYSYLNNNKIDNDTDKKRYLRVNFDTILSVSEILREHLTTNALIFLTISYAHKKSLTIIALQIMVSHQNNYTKLKF